MLDLAVVGNPDFTVCRLEADAERVSFTIETLRRLSENRPGDELVFLVGADMLRDLPNWREPDEICRLAVIAAVRRPGTGEPDYDALAGVVDAERLARFRRHQVDMPAMDVSSTDIRRRVAQGESIRYMTPPAVERMIIAERLYRDGE
jgi:nicotinate-nucleotide adenylyltransferase